MDELDAAPTAVRDAAGWPERRLARERDRLKLLLEVNNAVVSHLALDELLHIISESLRQIVPHEVSGIGLYDAEAGLLRAQVLEYPGDLPFFERGAPIPMEGHGGRGVHHRPASLRQQAGTRKI